MKQKLLYLLLIILFSIPAILPLFHAGFFQTDDGEWMVIRFSAFHQTLGDGQLPVRFLGRLNHGYGYPVANFLYPGFMYLAEPFHLIGLGFVDSVKLVMGLSMVGSGLFAFLWLSKRFNNLAALIGALFYIYTPYHLYDLYKRGSVGEILALAVMPFILWQIERESIFWSSVGVAALILSHNTLAVLFLPVIILYGLLKMEKTESIKRQVYMYTCILVFGFGISAFFWLPAIAELHYTKFSTVQVSEYSEYFASLSLIGISSLILLGISLSLLSKQKENVQVNRYLLLFISLAALSIFWASEYSELLWKQIPASFIQFPFRILSYLILSVSFLAAYAVSHFSGKAKVVVIIFLTIALAYSAHPLLQPKEYFDKGEGFYSTNEDTTTVKNEYIPKWVQEEPKEHFTEKVEGVEIDSLVYTNKIISFKASLGGKVRVNTIYYPGWKAYVNNEEVEIDYSNPAGVMEIPTVTTGSNIRLVFAETPLRMFANIISVLTGSLLLVITIIPRWRIYSTPQVEDHG